MANAPSAIDAALSLAAGDDVWLWVVPHGDDHLGASSKHVQTRIGVRNAHGLVARVEIRSRRNKTLGGWRHDLLDVTARKPRSVGSVHFEFNVDGELRGGHVSESRTFAARWGTGGLVKLPDASDACSLMTRGGPVHDEPIASVGEVLRDLGQAAGRLASRLLDRSDEPDDDAGEPAASPTSRDRLEGQPRLDRRDPALVSEELTAFDGWIRARQHDATDGPPPTESWRVRIDHDRPPPGPLGLMVVAAASATCHRRVLGGPIEGIIDLL